MNQKHKTYKTATMIALVLFVLGVVLILFTICRFQESDPLPKTNEVAISSKEVYPIAQITRESITFILGEDRELDNPYYAEAFNYYLFNEEGKTEYVVTTCRSLLEVRNYLAQNPPSNHLPWGLINLVSHGNQWLGLSVRVQPDGKRTSVENLQEYIDNSLFKPLPDTILDQQSQLFIHGCGVGNNHALVEAIGKAFGGKNITPRVKASCLFEYYASIKNNGAVIETQRYFTRVWYTVYKKGYRPEDFILCRKLQEKYPDTTMDWQDALSREQPRWAGDIYHYTFEVPVKWVISYPHKDSLPDVSTKEKQLEWIRSQPDIVTALEKIEIPVEKFNWWFRHVYVANDDGTRSPAIWLKGYSTILCVLQPLLDEKGDTGLLQKPFVPEDDDERYHYISSSI